MDVWIKGKRVKLTASNAIGKGGEADVYKVQGQAIKIWKSPQHPDLKNFPDEQLAAKHRLSEQQQKLPAFPRNLPGRVIVPLEMAFDGKKRLRGYSMKMIDNGIPLRKFYVDRLANTMGGNNLITSLFKDLHLTFSGIHQANVVIGDANDLNMLVVPDQAAIYIIDADSFQYGGFLCMMFTNHFMDPTLQNPSANVLSLGKPHNADSDWYAFSVMLFRSLLLVDPYGGVHKPKTGKRLKPVERVFKRVTVFSDEVRYPKHAVPYEVLSDDALNYYHNLFEKDVRGAFPTNLLERMRWTTCSSCQTEHCRRTCPVCSTAAPVVSLPAVTVRGTVTATRIFQTDGVIIRVAQQDKKLRWVLWDAGQFIRDSKQVVLKGRPDKVHVRPMGDRTAIAVRGHLLVMERDGTTSAKYSVDARPDGAPAFYTNGKHPYWIESGQLLVGQQFGPKHIGNVLTNQTHFWVGSDFGFGFYRAGNLQVGFVFQENGSGFNDDVKLPTYTGQLVDSWCHFSADRCWFLSVWQENGRTLHRCVVLDNRGNILATDEAEADDGSWLGGRPKAKCAAGHFLFSASDDGIVRVEADSGNIQETRKFPDTEKFVSGDCQLIATPDGIVVADYRSIVHLKIA